MGLTFLISSVNLCLGAFSPFPFKGVIDSYVFIAILLNVFCFLLFFSGFRFSSSLPLCVITFFGVVIGFLSLYFLYIY